MFDRILNMPYIHNPNQVTGFYVTNSNNSTKYVQTSCQKVYTKYTKFASSKKIQRSHHHEKKSWVEWSEISLFFNKNMPWLVQVYIAPFFTLYITLPWYHQNEKLMKQYIFETFTCCSQTNLLFLLAFRDPIFKQEKWNEVTGYIKHAAMAITCTMEKLM